MQPAFFFDRLRSELLRKSSPEKANRRYCTGFFMILKRNRTHLPENRIHLKKNPADLPENPTKLVEQRTNLLGNSTNLVK
jgi:hypothetical protein